MHLVVLFYNIGGYHAARLSATSRRCRERGWRLSAIQVTDHSHDQPWGSFANQTPFPIATLLPKAQFAATGDRRQSPLAAAVLPQHLQRLQPDILAIPGWGFPLSRVALRWCRRHQLPAILMSESKRDDEPRRWWKERLKSWLYIRRYDAALVGGELHRQYLIELGFPGDRIFRGYDVVDNDFFWEQAEIARQDPAAARARQPQIPTRPYFLVVTRFIPRKNVLALIQAYAAFRAGTTPAWDLVICGSGEEEGAIRQLIQTQGLQPWVHLPGFIPYRAIADWYGLAGALIHPARQEQWGLVVNEACAAGLPILCSRTVGAGHELVRQGQNGWRFDPGDPQSMTQAMLKLANLSPEARQQLGQQSRQLVSTYTPADFAAGLFQGIDQALSRRSDRR